MSFCFNLVPATFSCQWPTSGAIWHESAIPVVRLKCLGETLQVIVFKGKD